MYRIKEIPLKEIIDFSKSITNGSIFTKTLINKNKGIIPVYGASKDELEVGYGYVKDNLIITDKSNRKVAVRYFENCLTWNIDGSVAVFYRKGRFSLSEKVIPLIVYDNLKHMIDNDYLRYAILKAKEIRDFGFSNKAGKAKLANIMINIPVNNNGEYDIKVQKKFANIYQRIENRKKKLRERQKLLERMNIQVLNDVSYTYTKITDLFTPELGDGKYTKEECLNKKGIYPVYSGNTIEAFEYINEYTYDGEYLTWSKDGLAGYIMYHNEKFSITNHRGILKLNKDINNIDLNYLKIVLEPIFRRNIKGRLGIEGKNEYTTLSKNMIKGINEPIPIPIKANGQYDIDKQREIANKVKKVNAIKDNIIMEIQKINILDVDFSI